MKASSIIAKFVSAALLFSSFSLLAQASDEVCYRQVRSEGGRLSEVARNSLGNVYSGNMIEEIPGGTVLEVSSLGNGYCKAKSLDTGKEGIVDNSEEVEAAAVNPKMAVKQLFEYDWYEQEFPSLGDKPKTKNYLLIDYAGGDDPNEVKVFIREVIDPDTADENVRETLFYGKLQPFCISVEAVVANGELMPIDVFRIYNGFHKAYTSGNSYDYVIEAVYIQGNRWSKIN